MLAAVTVNAENPAEGKGLKHMKDELEMRNEQLA